jgi:hypothetical protein
VTEITEGRVVLLSVMPHFALMGREYVSFVALAEIAASEGACAGGRPCRARPMACGALLRADVGGDGCGRVAGVGVQGVRKFLWIAEEDAAKLYQKYTNQFVYAKHAAKLRVMLVKQFRRNV